MIIVVAWRWRCRQKGRECMIIIHFMFASGFWSWISNSSCCSFLRLKTLIGFQTFLHTHWERHILDYIQTRASGNFEEENVKKTPGNPALDSNPYTRYNYNPFQYWSWWWRWWRWSESRSTEKTYKQIPSLSVDIHGRLHDRNFRFFLEFRRWDFLIPGAVLVYVAKISCSLLL